MAETKTVNDGAGDIVSIVGDLNGRIDQLFAIVNDLSVEISGLDDRVTALEP